MPDVLGITLTKKFTYRDANDEEFSNTYWLTGPIPTDAAGYESVFLQAIAAETGCYHATTQVVRATGYASSDPHSHAQWSVEYPEGSHPGRLTGDGQTMAGDQAGVCEWRTDAKNSRGKPIYLRKYFHAGGIDAADPDRIGGNTIAAYQVFVAEMLGSAFSGAREIRGPTQQYGLLTPLVSPWVTTRTLKRRGKRKLPPP